VTGCGDDLDQSAAFNVQWSTDLDPRRGNKHLALADRTAPAQGPSPYAM